MIYWPWFIHDPESAWSSHCLQNHYRSLTLIASFWPKFKLKLNINYYTVLQRLSILIFFSFSFHSLQGLQDCRTVWVSGAVFDDLHMLSQQNTSNHFHWNCSCYYTALFKSLWSPIFTPPAYGSGCFYWELKKHGTLTQHWKYFTPAHRADFAPIHSNAKARLSALAVTHLYCTLWISCLPLGNLLGGKIVIYLFS